MRAQVGLGVVGVALVAVGWYATYEGSLLEQQVQLEAPKQAVQGKRASAEKLAERLLKEDKKRIEAYVHAQWGSMYARRANGCVSDEREQYLRNALSNYQVFLEFLIEEDERPENNIGIPSKERTDYESIVGELYLDVGDVEKGYKLLSAALEHERNRVEPREYARKKRDLDARVRALRSLKY
jgi:hypothetical protein